MVSLQIAGNGNEEQLKKNLKEVMDISDENDGMPFLHIVHGYI